MPLHTLGVSGGRGRRRVLNAPLVLAKGLLRERGKERKQQKGKTRKGGQALYTPFSIYLPLLFHYPLSCYTVLPKGISTKFLPKPLKVTSNTCCWFLLTKALRSLDTYALFQATKFFASSASKNAFGENPLYQPWWSKSTWETPWGCMLPSCARRQQLPCLRGALQAAWTRHTSPGCLLICSSAPKRVKKSMFQFYWDIWKVQSQKLPLLDAQRNVSKNTYLYVVKLQENFFVQISWNLQSKGLYWNFWFKLLHTSNVKASSKV